MLEEGTVAGLVNSEFTECADVTGVKVVATDSDMSSVFPRMESVEVGAVVSSDNVRTVPLTVEWDEVVASPEWDVS